VADVQIHYSKSLILIFLRSYSNFSCSIETMSTVNEVAPLQFHLTNASLGQGGLNSLAISWSVKVNIITYNSFVYLTLVKYYR